MQRKQCFCDLNDKDLPPPPPPPCFCDFLYASLNDKAHTTPHPHPLCRMRNPQFFKLLLGERFLSFKKLTPIERGGKNENCAKFACSECIPFSSTKEVNFITSDVSNIAGKMPNSADTVYSVYLCTSGQIQSGPQDQKSVKISHSVISLSPLLQHSKRWLYFLNLEITSKYFPLSMFCIMFKMLYTGN